MLTFEIDHHGQISLRTFESWECRGECAYQILWQLAERWPGLFHGRNGAIWYGDGPPPDDWSRGYDLAFASTKYAGRASTTLPFPCPMILRWPQVGIPDAQVMMNAILEDDTPFLDERIFWIGADMHPSRRGLFELGLQHPEIFDVEIIEWDRSAPGGQRSRTRQVSLPDHRPYKYLIDCPGIGYSARTKWLLAMGRPLFILDRDVVEHWHDELVPWLHYVPVKPDLSDLLDHHARLESDPALHRLIAENSRSFAREKLTLEARLQHIVAAMQQNAA